MNKVKHTTKTANRPLSPSLAKFKLPKTAIFPTINPPKASTIPRSSIYSKFQFLQSMASSSMTSLITLLLIAASLSAVASFEFQVGGTKGWVVPPANDTRIYNDWASENRFKAGDAVRFRYKKDTVMEVTEEEYKRCNSTQPSFFSNTGNTVFRFDRSGTFYFISGANGHCEKGQRMIVKVMSQDESSSSSMDGSEKSSAASRARISSLGFLKFVSVPLAMSCFGSILF